MTALSRSRWDFQISETLRSDLDSALGWAQAPAIRGLRNVSTSSDCLKLEATGQVFLPQIGFSPIAAAVPIQAVENQDVRQEPTGLVIRLHNAPAGPRRHKLLCSCSCCCGRENQGP